MSAFWSKLSYLYKQNFLILLLIFAISSLIYYLHTTSEFFKLTENYIKSPIKSEYEKWIVPGLGDAGKAAVLNGTAAEKLAIELGLNKTGFNVWLSQRIPLKRTLTDVRDKRCRELAYEDAVTLPRASIIIVHYNEPVHVVLRTLHSLYDNTPAKWLEEIILVNDNSDNGDEFETAEFGRYLTQHFHGLVVQLIKLEKHQGLMHARVRGARLAKAEVLVFLDAHIEATRDWLPPLLAPIAVNKRTCTTPIIDTIKYDTFEYVASQPSRGGFNWDFNYVQLPLLPAELAALPQPHINPIMNGGLFAINAEWFWHLGAYDEALSYWGGEQFELSLKLWLCGGRILEVPCSHVGHLYRHSDYHVSYTNKNNAKQYVEKNYKRVIEVWLDEYKDIIYSHIPVLTLIRAGDMRQQKALRRSLNCKPFKYFVEHVAPDLLKAYPLIEPNDYASGAVQSLTAPTLCLTATNKEAKNPVLQACSMDLKYPEAKQLWSLSYRRDLRQNGKCLEVRKWLRNAPVWLWPCHLKGGNQFWYYDRTTSMIVQGSTELDRRCLEAHVSSGRVFANDCDFGNSKQQWNFGYVNNTALDMFWQGLDSYVNKS